MKKIITFLKSFFTKKVKIVHLKKVPRPHRNPYDSNTSSASLPPASGSTGVPSGSIVWVSDYNIPAIAFNGGWNRLLTGSF